MAPSLSSGAIAACSVFMIIGPALIFLNQHILKSLHFPYPMCLSGIGVLSSGLYAYLMVALGIVKVNRAEAIEGWLWYRRVLPVGLASAATLAFGNMVYLHLDVGFIQMLKSFTPVVIMTTGYFARIEHISFPVSFSVLIIALGTAATCSFKPELNLYGVAIMYIAEQTEAIRLVLTQYFLQQLKFGVTEGLYVLAPASAFWLFAASIIFELPTMVEKDAFSIVAKYPFHFLAAASMGVGVNFIAFYVIQYTSGLTMKILATVRNIAMVIIGVIIYKESITFNEILGYAVALIGFAGYNMAKMGYFESNAPFMIEISKIFSSSNRNTNRDTEKETFLANKA